MGEPNFTFDSIVFLRVIIAAPTRAAAFENTQANRAPRNPNQRVQGTPTTIATTQAAAYATNTNDGERAALNTIACAVVAILRIDPRATQGSRAVIWVYLPA
jgi:hypothetical protein